MSTSCAPASYGESHISHLDSSECLARGEASRHHTHVHALHVEMVLHYLCKVAVDADGGHMPAYCG